MEKQITIKNDYNTLSEILTYLKKEKQFECSQVYDIWDMRTDSNGQMEQCILLKKSAMHGMKLYFTKANTLKLSYIIPNKIMNAYFGKSQKARRNILEIIAGLIKNAVLSGPQKKAFEEMAKSLDKITV